MKLTALVLLLFLNSKLYSQQSFIEVIVKDTAWVRPNNFIYRVTINKEINEKIEQLEFSNPKTYRQTIKQQGERNKALLDSIKGSLVRSGFDVLSPFLYDQFEKGNEGYKVYNLDVLTGSLDSLRFLSELISKNTSLSGSVLKIFSTTEDQFLKLLYDKLLSQARVKAGNIAASSERKLGAVISVVQGIVENDSGGWTIYPPLSALSDRVVPGWHTRIVDNNYPLISNQNTVTDYLIRDQLTVRFMLE